jgi:transposase
VTAFEEILQRLDALEKKAAVAERERDEYRALYLETMARCRKLELGILAQKSERMPEGGAQLSLNVLSMVLNERQRADLDAALAVVDAEQEVKAHTRKKPTGRKPLPEHLPRVEITVVPPEVEKEGLDAFDRIGEDTSETIERRPASFVVARVIRPKFVRKDRDREALTHVLIAEPLELPIPKGLAGPGMLADTIVKRWQDHMPLNRLEDMYARDGVELARSTMCGWHAALAEVVTPLVAAMRDDAFKQPYLCVDATGVLVQQKERCRTGHFWVLVAPGRHVLFEFTRDHSNAVKASLSQTHTSSTTTSTPPATSSRSTAGRTRAGISSRPSTPIPTERRSRSASSAPSFASSAHSPTLHGRRRRRSARRDPATSSMHFSPGVMPRQPVCSTTRPSPAASATHEISASVSLGSSKTGASLSTTT